jgi:hypothetical protein
MVVKLTADFHSLSRITRMAIYVQRQNGKALNLAHFERAFIALALRIQQANAYAPYYLRAAPIYSISPHYLKNGLMKKKKVTQNGCFDLI